MFNVLHTSGLRVGPEITGKALSNATRGEDAPFEFEFGHCGIFVGCVYCSGVVEGKKERARMEERNTATCNNATAFEHCSHAGPRAVGVSTAW